MLDIEEHILELYLVGMNFSKTCRRSHGWPDDDSLESKHVTVSIILLINCCLT